KYWAKIARKRNRSIVILNYAILLNFRIVKGEFRMLGIQEFSLCSGTTYSKNTLHLIFGKIFENLQVKI
ncbi:MAG: hypothetical protein QNK78_09800, partial [Crocinitomicaceae bacterium]